MEEKYIFAVMERQSIIKISDSKEELEAYRNSFPLEERRGMVICVLGVKAEGGNPTVKEGGAIK